MSSDHWVQPFLEALRETGVIERAATAASVRTATVYARRKSDADFEAAFENAMEDAIDTLEAEARRRAVQGWEEPVVYQGQLTPIYERDERGQIVMDEYDTGVPGKDGKPVIAHRPRQLVIDGKPQWLTINKRSDALLQFLLKGLRAKYGTERTELTGAGGGPVVLDETKRAARVAALLRAAEARKADVDDLA